MLVEGGAFLPVYGELNATPPVNMHVDAKSSYANFRFLSEPMLTGTAILPKEVMAYWLHLHNAKGGRLGGQSRFEDHLDDMPTAGWGYGALVNNQTQDFMELLYGHAANYQSRGTFHSTEQLSFVGTGRYRGFLHIKDPTPGSPDATAENLPSVGSGLGYNGGENDISFCIVSNILVAHMTRWQLIMENDGAIWLGRGAPKRWFTPGNGGFNVSAAPSTVGLVDFTLAVSTAATAQYSVTTKTPAAIGARWSMRWPGALKVGSARCTDCEIVAEDPALGIVSVRSHAAKFQLVAEWS